MGLFSLLEFARVIKASSRNPPSSGTISDLSAQYRSKIADKNKVEPKENNQKIKNDEGRKSVWINTISSYYSILVPLRKEKGWNHLLGDFTDL
jgi:hypothetical protein